MLRLPVVFCCHGCVGRNPADERHEFAEVVSRLYILSDHNATEHTAGISLYSHGVTYLKTLEAHEMYPIWK